MACPAQQVPPTRGVPERTVRRLPRPGTETAAAAPGAVLNKKYDQLIILNFGGNTEQKHGFLTLTTAYFAV